MFRLLLALCALSSLFSSHSNAKEFLIISPTNQLSHGFFSCADLVLSHLYLFDKGSYSGSVSGMKVDFGTKGFYYHKPLGNNWWEYYFEPTLIGNHIKKIRHTTQRENMNAWKIRRTEIDKDNAHRIINKYIRVKKSILRATKHFQDSNFQDYYVVGIHYRGTDKAAHIAPRVPYQTVVKVVREHLKNINKEHKIFIATDEQGFLNYMQSEFPDKIIATDAIRSTNNVAVHKMETNPYKKGQEALIDCLLLSKCDILFRTSSNLSLWSTFFNPSLPEVLLSHHKNGLE